MDNWETEDYEEKADVAADDRWEGEDEDEDLLDNWDDEPEEEKKEEDKPAEAPKTEKSAAPKKSKKAMKAMLKEKEEKERLEREARIEAEMNKTPEDKLADRLRAQKLVEDSDFAVAQDMFADRRAVDPNLVTIDNMEPKTKDDFNKLVDMLKKKMATLEASPHYSHLVESLLQNAMIPLNAETLRKMATSCNVLANEKQKLEKAKKGGKKASGKKSLAVGKGVAKQQQSTYDDYVDDFDDFM